MSRFFEEFSIDTKLADGIFCCTPTLKATLGSSPNDDQLRMFAGMRSNGLEAIDTIVVITQRGLLEYLRLSSTTTTQPYIDSSPREIEGSCCYIQKYGAIGRELWYDTMSPLMNSWAEYSARSALDNALAQAKVLVITRYPWTPKFQCSSTEEAKKLFEMRIAECAAFCAIGCPARGVQCCRGGTRLTPDGFSSVLRSVSFPDWKACELPKEGHRCCAVIVPAPPQAQAQGTGTKSKATAWFFDKSTGLMLDDAPTELCRGPQYSDVPTPTGSLVIECCWNKDVYGIRAYDCMVCDGRDIRDAPLVQRLAAAARYLGLWVPTAVMDSGSSSSSSIVPSVVAYGPPISLVKESSAKIVLFVKNSAPYAIHAGGDAFIWKEPTLADGQIVAVCRHNDIMAAHSKAECFIDKVGELAQCDQRDKAPVFMGCYVLQASAPADADEPNTEWQVVRRAKRTEKLFTVDECSAARPTQITRAGMVRLLHQLSQPDSATQKPLGVETRPARGAFTSITPQSRTPAQQPAVMTKRTTKPKQQQQPVKSSGKPRSSNLFDVLSSDA